MPTEIMGRKIGNTGFGLMGKSMARLTLLRQPN